MNFEPSVGTEIQKTRPSVVVQVDNLITMPRTIVMPITDWKTHYALCPWMVCLHPTAENGLKKLSGIDASQIKSFDNSRFRHRMGALYPEDMDEVLRALTVCVGRTTGPGRSAFPEEETKQREE